MDHMMSLRSTYPPDTTAEFHSPGVEFFSSQGSPFPAVSYGQQSSINPQSGNTPAYSLSADLQHGHNIAQSYQPNMSEGQMASAFMCQNQPQPLADHFYAFQTPTLYQQKHQPATNQMIQNPSSPCHNQTYPVSTHQSPNSQFVPLQGHPLSPQMSPRHFAQHQTAQIMVYNQKHHRIQSSPNQQHQALVSASAQSQRLNQSPKQIVSKQQNNSKDRTTDAQFYSNQILLRNDTSVNNIHKSQTNISKPGHTAQAAHAPQYFHNGGTHSENKVNNDSQFRNIQASHYGSSMKAQSSKPSGYASQTSFEHINTSVPSNLQPSRYESIINNSQRVQKASPGKAGVTYMPEMAKNRKYSSNFILPDYSGSPSSSKTPPNKPSPDPTSGAFAYAQNMHYKPRNPHDISLDNREGEKLISRNVGTRTARPAGGGSEHLDNLSDLLFSHSYALPSIATLVESTKEAGRLYNKVSDNITSVRNNKSSSQMMIAQKNSETVSPVYWFKNPDPSLASSFQSDIEAMQADIDSYANNNRMSRTPVRASPVSHKALGLRSKESHISGQSGLNQTTQMSEVMKAGNVSAAGERPKSGSSPVNARSSKADALAAIMIKQELVDSLSKYKSSSPNSTTVNSSSTKAALQTSNMKKAIPSSVQDMAALINKLPSDVTDHGESISSQQQLDLNARRHSLSETNKARQHINASPNNFLYNMQKPCKTSESAAETVAASYLQQQNVTDQHFLSGQQAVIQSRRNTTPSMQDRPSGGIYKAAVSPDGRQNPQMYRSPVGTHRIGSQNPLSQNSIHHLVEQVQSIDVPYLHSQQQRIAAITNSKQAEISHSIDKIGLGQCKPVEATVCVKQPTLTAALSNGTFQQVTPTKNTVIEMEKLGDPCKPISMICYVMLHGYKLVCLKSSSETLLLLCQFQVSCFPDRSLQNVNICIDQTLQIKRRVLNHQDLDKVVLFLKENGFHLGNVFQIITLCDARRVYHHLYGIKNCTDSSCIKEILSDFDHNTEISSTYVGSVGKELKKETTPDDSNCEQFVPVKSPDKNITRKEDFKNTMNHNGTKPVSPHVSTSLPHSGKNNVKIDQRVAVEKDVDSDDSDDLILVEASEDPHIIRWSGNAPKVGGICNTIIGQLRSYVHGNERFLVVDDLCRAFGTTDFYDGVEKENIILYSCCQEIAQFLNAMHNSFPPLQSVHHSLVKEKDIGIHIIEGDGSPNGRGFEKDKMGSQTFKRLLCKQEIVDDECTPSKQLKLGDTAQLLESSKQQSSSTVQTFLLTPCQSDDSVKNVSSLDLQVPRTSERHTSRKLVPKVEETSKVVKYTENEISDTGEHTSQSFVVNQPAGQVLQCKSDQKNVSKFSLLSEAQNIQDAQSDRDQCSERTASEKLSTHLLKETTEIQLVTQSVSRISGHKRCLDEQQPKSCIDALAIITDSASTAEMTLVQPSESYSPESPSATDTFGDVFSPSIDEDNSKGLMLTTKEGGNKQSKCGSDLLTKVTCQNVSDMQSLQTSALNSRGSASNVNKHDQEKDHSEASVNKQTEDLNLAPLDSCSIEDLIMSNSTSSTLKDRVEKLKYILETRRSKNLPLPRLSLDSSLNLHLVTSRGSQDKSSSTDTSSTDLAVGRLGSAASSNECSNSNSERLHVDSGTDCVISPAKSGSLSQGLDNAGISFPENSKLSAATACSTKDGLDNRILCSSSSSSELQTAPPADKSKNSVDLQSQGVVEASLAKYFPKSHRSLDDSDIMFSGNIDPLDILPSQCWKEYAKLFQEHRALQGLFGEQQKRILHMKAEKERSDKIKKYYEGVICDITTTFKNGDEDTPVVIDDD